MFSCRFPYTFLTRPGISSAMVIALNDALAFGWKPCVQRVAVSVAAAPCGGA